MYLLPGFVLLMWLLAVPCAAAQDGKVGAGLSAEDEATGSASPTQLASPEELRQVARMQQELKDELAGIGSRLDTFDQRLINLEKRIRLGGDLQLLIRRYTAPDRRYGPDHLRIGTGLKLEADLAPDVAYTGHLQLLGQGVHSLANGHQATDGGSFEEQSAAYFDQPSPLYLRSSYFSWTPPSLAVYGGLTTFSNVLPVGSTIANDFGTASIWPNAEGGYGFVGTPPVQTIGQRRTIEDVRIKAFEAPGLTPGASPLRTSRIPYHPGINVVQDLLDPNSARDVNWGSAGTVAVVGTLGPLELGAGVNNGVSGARSALAITSMPNTFPLIADLGNGYGLVKAGLDLGIFRAAAVGRADNNALAQIGNFDDGRGKGFGFNVDLGTDEAGLAVAFASMTRSGNDTRAYSETGAVLSSNNILGLGLGAGLGVKLGSAPIAGYLQPNPSLRDLKLTAAGEKGFQIEKNQLLPWVSYNWTSTGFYFKFPGFSLIPSLTFAAQTSGWDLVDSNFGSGLTAIAEIQPHPGLPKAFLQYDLGKFSTNPNKWNALFGKDDADPAKPSATPITHEQFVLGTQLKF